MRQILIACGLLVVGGVAGWGSGTVFRSQTGPAAVGRSGAEVTVVPTTVESSAPADGTVWGFPEPVPPETPVTLLSEEPRIIGTPDTSVLPEATPPDVNGPG